MKYRYFIIILLLLSPLVGNSQNTSLENETELQKSLVKAQGSKRLFVLKQLAESYWNVPKEEYWLKRLYNESLKSDSLAVAENALCALARYYHNNEKTKELEKCSVLSDKISRRLATYSADFFTIKSYLSQRYLWNEQFGKAVFQTTLLLQLAVKTNNKIGEETCEDVMGLIYQQLGRQERAFNHFLRAYSLLLRYQPDSFTAIAQLQTTLIETSLKLNRLDDAYKFITAFENIQVDVSRGKRYGYHPDFPIRRNYRLAYIYTADYYLRKNDLSKVKDYLQRAAAIKESDVYLDFLWNYETAQYKALQKDYLSALSYINKVIKVDGGSTMEYLKFRADIYADLGNTNKSLAEYKRCLQIQQDSANIIFDRQVAHLQHVHDAKQMEIQLKDSEIRLQKIHNKELFIISLFLLLISIALAVFLIRNRKLQRLLKKNNKKLADSDKSLKQALVKAGEVDTLKTSFIHSVNHEIRTPLNAIVGFSAMLASDDGSKDERREYGAIVKQNSDALLDLIGKMIDISKYEVSTATMNSKDLVLCNIQELCGTCLDDLKSSGKLSDNVKLEFYGSPENYMLTTIPSRLQQIILNLLMNAAKYTTSGVISLSYRISSDVRYVVFSVTDTGKGIDSDMRKDLFKSFQKGDSFEQGIGLGLTLCSIIAKSFGGKIYLDEEYHNGSRFIFTHSTSLKGISIK